MRVFLAGVASTALSAAPALAQPQGGQYGYGWNDHMMGWWFPFGGILMFLVMAAVVVAAVLVIRYLWNIGHGHGPATRDEAASRRAALEILDQRYARGELEREEYLQRKEDLQK